MKARELARKVALGVVLGVWLVALVLAGGASLARSALEDEGGDS